jgi:alkylation response protein AidB-like acyl-CoA dehydrogenase
VTPDYSTNPIALAKMLAAEFSSRACEADRRAKLPYEDLEALHKSAYLTISIPRSEGGMGCSLAECVAAQMELAQGNSSTTLVAGMQIHLFGHAHEAHEWQEGVFERLCNLAVNENALFNSAASEPELGSPSRGGIFQTSIQDEQDELILNGQKTWVSGGAQLTHLLVRADYQGQAAVILVPNHLNGITWKRTWENSLSLRASESDDVYFYNVHIPKENLIDLNPAPKPNAWFPLIMASVYLGTALAARNDAIEYGLERVPTALGQPIATLPKIQRQLGEIDLGLQAAQSLLLEVAREWDGKETIRSSSMYRVAAAKQFCVDAALIATEKALALVGGRSISGELPFERYFRDVRAGMMQPPSGDTALQIIGKHLFDTHKPD